MATRTPTSGPTGSTSTRRTRSRRPRGWLAHGAAERDHLTFAVVPLADGVARGLTSLYRIDPPNGSIEVGGIVYARSLQRTPASTEATYLLARHLFDELGYRRLEWKLDSCNEPSAAAARRLGFTYEGRHRHAIVYKGRNRDTDWFSIIDAEWPAIRSGSRPGSTRPTSTTTAGSGPPCPPGWEDDHGPARLVHHPRRRPTSVPPGGSTSTASAGTPAFEQAGEVLMFEVADKVVLSLWAESGFEDEVGPIRRGSGLVPITLAHNLATREEVDAVLADARAAGATEVSRRASSVSGAATPATSPTPTASAGRSPTTPARSGRSVPGLSADDVGPPSHDLRDA